MGTVSIIIQTRKSLQSFSPWPQFERKFTGRSGLPGPYCFRSAALYFLKQFVKGGPEFFVAAGYCFFMPGLWLVLEVALLFLLTIKLVHKKKEYLSPFFEPYIEDKA